jgi:hypothetical protein
MNAAAYLLAELLDLSVVGEDGVHVRLLGLGARAQLYLTTQITYVTKSLYFFYWALICDND